jgi:hypothetical protein
MSDGEKLVLASLQDGWTSFRRAAFPLMASALLMAGLLAATQLLPRLPGQLLALLVSLWGSTGLLRGAAAADDGRRPGPGLLLRRDRRGCQRLLLASLLVLALMALATLPGYALVALSVRFAPASDPITTLLVALLPLLPALVILHALPVGPLLIPDANGQERSVPLALRHSWRLVAARRGAVLVLAAVQLAVLQVSSGVQPLLGVGLGLPLAICLGSATTRRLSRAAGC